VWEKKNISEHFVPNCVRDICREIYRSAERFAVCRQITRLSRFPDRRRRVNMFTVIDDSKTTRQNAPSRVTTANNGFNRSTVYLKHVLSAAVTEKISRRFECTVVFIASRRVPAARWAGLRRNSAKLDKTRDWVRGLDQMVQRLETGFSCTNTLSMKFNTDESNVGKFDIWVLPNFDVIQPTVRRVPNDSLSPTVTVARFPGRRLISRSSVSNAFRLWKYTCT